LTLILWRAEGRLNSEGPYVALHLKFIRLALLSRRFRTVVGVHNFFADDDFVLSQPALAAVDPTSSGVLGGSQVEFQSLDTPGNVKLRLPPRHSRRDLSLRLGPEGAVEGAHTQHVL
jgi:hypothetical protein